MSENYLTPAELRRVADKCEALEPLWDILTTADKIATVEMAEDMNFGLDVFDSNGEVLGRISWCESGVAFYPGTSDGAS